MLLLQQWASLKRSNEGSSLIKACGMLLYSLFHCGLQCTKASDIFLLCILLFLTLLLPFLYSMSFVPNRGMKNVMTLSAAVCCNLRSEINQFVPVTNHQEFCMRTTLLCIDTPYVPVKSKLKHPPPPGHTPGIWRLFLPEREGIWLT